MGYAARSFQTIVSGLGKKNKTNRAEVQEPMQQVDHQLVSLIYQSATDPTKWPKVPQLLARSLGTHQAIVIRSEGKEIQPDDVTTFGIDHEIRQQYLDILADDPWLLGMLDLPHCSPCFSDQFLTLRELRRLPFYQLLCAPSDVAYMGGAVVHNNDNVTYLFAGQRDEVQGIFREEELAHIRMLITHFDKARAIGHKIGALQNSVRALRRVLDKSAFGVFLINEHAAVTWCNAPGEAILRKDDGLSLRLSHLSTTSCQTNRNIDAALTNAIATSSGRGDSAGAYISVQRPSNKRPYQLTISPISKRDAWGADAFAVVFVLDPDRPPDMSLEAFQSLFGLTGAEARVARALFLGFSVQEAADRFEVSPNTIRTQLKAILRKCNVRSQSELMQLLTRAAIH